MHDDTKPELPLSVRSDVGGVRPLVVGVLLLVAAGTGGCGLSSLTSGFGGSSAAASRGVNEEQLLSAAKADVTASSAGSGDVAHGCPQVVVGTREASLTVYEPGREGDALAVRHRGEITKTARECAIEPGRVSVKYGFSGRVLMGPKGQPGAVQLPLKVYVADTRLKPIANDTAVVGTAISLEKPIGYFSMVRTITFPIPEGTRPGEFEVHVGFEQKPALPR